jgi:hypothetical protein
MRPPRAPETAARVQAMLTECDECDAPRNAAIAQQQAAITAAGLATGATAQGPSLQALIIAPRITWETKGMPTHSTLPRTCWRLARSGSRACRGGPSAGRTAPAMHGQMRGAKDTPMVTRPWLATYPRIKAVVTWDAFLDALCSEPPYPEYDPCLLCGKKDSLVEVDCGPWAAGEPTGLAMPATETRSWGVLCRDQISDLVGGHGVCRPCLLAVVQSGELPWDPDD